MSIKEQTLKKIRKATIVAFVFWFATLVTLFVPGHGYFLLLPLVPIAGLFGAVVYLFFFIRCTECGTSLGGAPAMGGNPFTLSKLNFCPNCGVDLNKRISS